MNRTSLPHRKPTSLRRALPGTLAALAVGFSMSSHAAGGGEALDIELPSMRTPVPAATVLANRGGAVVTNVRQGPLTRAEVREALKMARLSNTMTPSGEIGDTPAVLQAREDFNALQTEVLQAEYVAATEREQEIAMALRTSMDAPPVAASGPQLVVAPEMTVGELMSLVEDSRTEGTVIVVLPNEDENEAD